MSMTGGPFFGEAAISATVNDVVVENRSFVLTALRVVVLRFYYTASRSRKKRKRRYGRNRPSRPNDAPCDCLLLLK